MKNIEIAQLPHMLNSASNTLNTYADDCVDNGLVTMMVMNIHTFSL